MRIPFLAGAAVGLALCSARADEMEQGIHYICDESHGALHIQSVDRSGGGSEDPFEQMETSNEALWNVDRLKKPLPIMKQCKLGKRNLTTIISKTCSAGQGGWTPQVQVYVDVDISKERDGTLKIEDHYLLSSVPVSPLVTVRYFGGLCFAGPLGFTAIEVDRVEDTDDFMVQVK